jgi:hypothetical protein
MVDAVVGLDADQRTVRARFWLESLLASSCGLLGALTVFWRDWIEAATGLDPDRHSGSMEWAIVAGLFLVCLLVGVAARGEWRRAKAAASGS